MLLAIPVRKAQIDEMIKLSNISKEYSTKSAVTVKALDGITLDLPERGFIFLLGKSGSGKSTLLNLIAGLDRATDGDIYINDQSIRNYSSRELDDYRNTKIGFVFQDFNLLNEYNVYNNIALTLKLRGDKDIERIIKNALQCVDMEGYGSRKINELSGGQKQRIAIARALATGNEIILADEPTGNLDSANSGEIFSLLKKISANRLVIVVTHDRESACKYADRIIGLADGKVISDELQSSAMNIRYENTYSDRINSEILSRKCDSACVKKRGKIAFLATLSFANIWKKKFKLIVSVILMFTTLSMLGLVLTTARYDKALVTYSTLVNNGINEIKVGKSSELSIEDKSLNLFFTHQYLTDLESRFPDRKFNYIMNFTNNFFDLRDTAINIRSAVRIDQSVLKQYDYELWGALPIKHNEICVSKFYADYIIENAIYPGLNSYEQLKNIVIKSTLYNDIDFKIVGIVDTKFKQLYNKLRALNEDNDVIEHVMQEELKGSFTSSLMVGQEFYEKLYYNYDNWDNKMQYSYLYYHPTLSAEQEAPSLKEGASRAVQANYAAMMGTYGDIVYRQGKSELNKGEILVSRSFIRNMARSLFPSIATDNITDEHLHVLLESDISVINGVTSAVSNEKHNYRIVGYYTGNQTNIIDDFILNNDETKGINPQYAAVAINTAFSGDKDKDLQLLKEFLSDNYELNNACSTDLQSANFMASIFSRFGLYASLALGIFAVIMLTNFIVTSINSSSKQIGILRALGMSGSGVLFIFLVESLFVGLIGFALSAIAIYPLTLLMSQIIFVYIVKVPVFIVTAVDVLIIFGLSIAATCLACIIPIIKKAHTQPIKLIKE